MKSPLNSARIPLTIATLGAAIAVAQTDPGKLAFSLEREGKLVEAEAAWSALAHQYPTNPEPLAHMGFIESRQEHYAEAIKCYRRAMALNPAMPGLRLNLGLAFFKAGEYQQALQELEPLLKAQPDDQQLTILVGMSHYGLGQFAKASPLLKQASERDAQNLTLLLTLAHSCLLSNQYQCVLDEFHQIMSVSPDSAEAHVLAGEALDEMKDTQSAVREFRAAVQADPREPNVHFGLGYLLWEQGQHEQAAQEFQSELDNDPQNLQAMLYLADSQIKMNRMEDARLSLEKVVKIDPANPMGHLDLGSVYTEAGRNADALRELKTAAALNPEDVKPHWQLARLYRSMGKTAEANAELTKTKSMNKAADEGLLKAMSRVPPQNNAPQSAAGKK